MAINLIGRAHIRRASLYMQLKINSIMQMRFNIFGNGSKQFLHRNYILCFY